MMKLPVTVHNILFVQCLALLNLFSGLCLFFRLCFAGEVEEEGSSSSYNADDGSYIVNVKKKIIGEVFENLDLLTTLLCNKKPSNPTKPLIEVINHSKKCVVIIFCLCRMY